MNETRAIGILDSGVGGLTVVREVIRQLPRERIVYFGDTARCPYGPRSAEIVRRFTLEIVEFLCASVPLKALVIACNTATAFALEDVRRAVPVPVVGVIHPGARTAIKASSSGRIGVIGTQGTIQSGAYERALHHISPELEVISLACPTLVPLVENGNAEAEDTLSFVEQALRPLHEHHLDTLILGCTHYPLLMDHIARVMGPDIQLISSAEETARELSAILHHREMLTSPTSKFIEPLFFTSGDPSLFQRIATRWLKREVNVKCESLKVV